MDWLAEVFDLAAVASGAGLLGGAAGTGIALAFSGVIVKFLARLATTAIMTGVGYLALLNWLGFEIIPPENIAIPGIGQDVGGIFNPALLPDGTRMDGDTIVLKADAEVENPDRAYVVKSPFRRGRVQ